MKVDHAADSRVLCHSMPPAFQRENLFDKIFPEFGIMQPSFLFNRNEGKMRREYPGENPNPLFFRHAFGVVDFDPEQAAAWRILFEDIAAQVLPFQLPDPCFRPVLHLFRMVHAGFGGDKTRLFYIAHQPHGFPGYAEARLHFRAYRNIVHVLPEGIAEEVVELVPAVVAHVFTQQAGADPYFDVFFHDGDPFSRWIFFYISTIMTPYIIFNTAGIKI